MASTYQPFKNEGDEGGAPPSYTAPPQVAVQMPGQQSYVIQQPHQMTILESTPRWSWCNLITAIFGFFCCQITGFIAVVIAMLAYSDHKGKDFERSRHKRSISCCLGVTSIVIGSLGIVTVIIIVAVISANAVNTVENFSSNQFGN